MRIQTYHEIGPEIGHGHSYHLTEVMKRLRGKEPKQNLVIIDALQPSPELLNHHSRTGDKVVILNPLHPDWYECMTVAPDMSPGFQNKRQGNHFYGPRYWFLRDEFRQQNRKPHGVGVMLGGTDPLNLTDAFIREVKGKRIEGSGIGRQMASCEVMIASCGMGFWESLAVGTPTIPIAANESQRLQYSVFKLANPKIICQMLQDKEWVEPDPKYEIGQGWAEVIEEMLC